MRAPILIVLAILAAFLMQAILVSINLPQSQSRVDITLEEAQSLVSFPICVPTYISSGIDANPKIIYDAEEGNIPQETYIRLIYKRVDDGEDVIEIIQNYTSNKGMKAEYFESELGRAEVSLLDWMFPWRFFSEKKLNAALEQTQMEGSVSQTGETVWLFYEIVFPDNYRSTMTKWVDNQVEYRILSYLPAEEIKKVTLSMLECSSLR